MSKHVGPLRGKFVQFLVLLDTLKRGHRDVLKVTLLLKDAIHHTRVTN